jgi:hypothetical protein
MQILKIPYRKRKIKAKTTMMMAAPSISAELRDVVSMFLCYFFLEAVSAFFSRPLLIRHHTYLLTKFFKIVRIPYSKRGNRFILIRPGLTGTRAPLARSSSFFKTSRKCVKSVPACCGNQSCVVSDCEKWQK